MEARGIYLAPRRRRGRGSGGKPARRSTTASATWLPIGRSGCAPTTPPQFRSSPPGAAQFQNFARELANIATGVEPAGGARVGRYRRQPRHAEGAERGPEPARRGLCAARRAHLRARSTGRSIRPPGSTSLLGIVAVLLAAAGALIIRQRGGAPARHDHPASPSRSRPAVRRWRCPTATARDEVGALARSIAVFQDAMRRNEELSQMVVDDAQARAQRQERMSAEIAQFRRRCRSDAGRARPHLGSDAGGLRRSLSGAADNAAHRTAGRCRGVRRRLRQCARHRVRGRRARRLGGGDRPPGRAVEHHRRQGGERGRADQRHRQRSSTRPPAASATWSG